MNSDTKANTNVQAVGVNDVIYVDAIEEFEYIVKNINDESISKDTIKRVMDAYDHIIQNLETLLRIDIDIIRRIFDIQL